MPSHLTAIDIDELSAASDWRSLRETFTRLSEIAVVHVVTSTSTSLFEPTRIWLGQRRVPHSRVEFSKYSSKKDLASRYDFVISESPEVCQEFAKLGAVSFLLNGWSREGAVGPYYNHLVRRVDSLQSAEIEIAQIIQRMGAYNFRNGLASGSHLNWRRRVAYCGDPRGHLIAGSDLILESLLGQFYSLPKSGTALDVCCGIGVVSATLARLGFDVVSIDIDSMKTAHCWANLLLSRASSSSAVITADARLLFSTVALEAEIVHFDPDWGPPGHDAEVLSDTRPSGVELLPYLERAARRMVLMRMPLHMVTTDLAVFGAAVFECTDATTGEAFIYACLGKDVPRRASWKGDGIQINRRQ
jgi:hypothetical protein